MVRQKYSKSSSVGRIVKTKAGMMSLAPAFAGEAVLVPAPKLRRMIGVSAVTLWRWRAYAGFPAATTINGRNYFPWADVEAWLASQQRAA
jgi:hypothetical protein